MKRINQPTILIAYTLLTLLMTWPLAQNFTAAIPGDGFDGWQNYWNLWWIKVALIDKLQHPFYTDILYAPTGVGLYFHTLNPFNGLVTLPIQLSMGLIPAYNSVVLLSWVLGGYGAYLLTSYQLSATSNQQPATNYQLPAFIAGVIFTFAPFHMAHLLGHMQVMSLQWIPFYILYLLRALDCSIPNQKISVHPRTSASKKNSWRREAALAALFLILTGLCDWYFVLYLFLFTGIVVVWRALSSLHEDNKLQKLYHIIAPPIVIGFIFCFVMSPLLIPMASQVLEYDFMVRPATDLYILSASLMDFLVPNRLHTLFRPESFGWIGNQIAPVSERTISLGYVPLLLAIIALWASWQQAKRQRANQQRVIFWLAIMISFILLALGPQIHLGNIDWNEIPADADTVLDQSNTPFSLFNRFVPLMRISRSVSRYALMAQLALAVLAGFGLASILSYAKSRINRTRMNADGRRLGRRAFGLSTIVLILILAEYWVAPYPLSPPDTPPFYKELSAIGNNHQSPTTNYQLPATNYQPPTTILNLPMNYDRPGYLLYQTIHQRPLAVAYISRDDPRTLTERIPVLQHFRHLGPDIIDTDPARVGMTVLNDLGIGHVILDRYKMPNLESQERQYTTELAQAIFANQTALYEDDRLTVFEVHAPEEPEPYLILGQHNWGPLREGLGRPLLNGGASFRLHHGRNETQVTLRYRTQPGVTLYLLDSATQNSIVTLPPAPEGRSELIHLGSVDTVFIRVDGARGKGNSAIIEQVKLE